MKVFFGDSLDDMINELRAQAVNSVRLHVFGTMEGHNLVTSGHITTFCNNQIYESVVEETISLEDVPSEQHEKFMREAREKARSALVERLSGFEIRRGVLQQ